ncbi:MAG: efflux RND transporter periplasmic adaptor subunit [Planctomycetota bacterium]|nr:efflux RND transporter periplasmic adaptor subunit [Planctomycetota bacterium]
MKSILLWGLILLGIGIGGWFAYPAVSTYLQDRNRPLWKTAKVEKGPMVFSVNSTGTVKPVLSVAIGSFVSGPIIELNVDFNDSVKAGEVLAKVDPRLFAANVARDRAILASRQAELDRVEAQLELSKINEKRGRQLREDKKNFMSEAEMDTLAFEVKSLDAQRRLAMAAIEQSAATLDNSIATLEYCEIKSPVDGMIIDRKIEPGQTLAAQFQTPELFVIAPDLREKIHVFASVDETDIGWIQKAKEERRPVTFTVDAHPGELFQGEVEQIRVSSASVQNVVTYPVIIAASNPELKLLPGMTASISFEIDSRVSVLKIPTAALRFFPEVEQVRVEDRGLVDGSGFSESSDASNERMYSATEQVEANQKQSRRHVWVSRGRLLEAVEVFTGIDESRFTELVRGDLQEGDALVVGIQPKF